MKDSEFLELLNLYLDHEISPADAARLEADSPLTILARGYSITSLAGSPSALTSAVGVGPSAELVTQLTDGRVWSRVERVERTEPDASQP